MILACFAGGLYLAYHFRAVLVPFGLSFALAYLANPLVNLFEARGLRRDRVVVMLYLVIATGISTTASILLPVITKELELLQGNAPMYFMKSKDYLVHLQIMLAHKLPIGQKMAEHWSIRCTTR